MTSLYRLRSRTSNVESLENRTLLSAEPTGLFADSAEVLDLNDAQVQPNILLGAEYQDGYVVLARDGVGDYEIWQTDGSESRLLHEIYSNVPVDAEYAYEFLRVIEDQIYAQLNSYTERRVPESFDGLSFLWSADADAADPLIQLGDASIDYAYPRQQLEEHNGELIMKSVRWWGGSSSSGSILLSDGTVGGTRQVGNTLRQSFVSSIDEIVRLGDDWYFLGVNDEAFGLYKVDLAATETAEQIRPVRSFRGSLFGDVENPSRLVAQDGLLYFFADAGQGEQFWQSDGTRDGTVPNPDPSIWQEPPPRPGRFEPFQGDEVFVEGNRLLTRADEQSPPDLLLTVPEPTKSSDLVELTSQGDSLFFVDFELGNLKVLRDGIVEQVPGDQFRHLDFDSYTHSTRTAVVGDSLFAFGADGLHVYDATTLESELIAPGITTLNASPWPVKIEPTASVDTLYFFRKYQNKIELWSSDGTIEGTTLLSTESSQAAGGAEIPPAIKYHNGVIYYVNGGFKNRMFAYDVATKESGATRAENIKSIASLGDKVVALGRADGGFNLWNQDAEGKFGKFDFISTPNRARPSEIAQPSEMGELNGFLYFTDGAGNLWKTDGTQGQTEVVRSFGPTDCCFRDGKGSLVVASDMIFFTLGDNANGNELWVSDGTAEGTKLALDVRPGRNSSHPTELTVVGDKLYFAANDGQLGRELWSIDLLAAEQTLDGDTDGDGVVDFNDFLVVSANFNKSVTGGNSDGDFDDNGVVDEADFLLLSENFGRRTTERIPLAAELPPPPEVATVDIIFEQSVEDGEQDKAFSLTI